MTAAAPRTPSAPAGVYVHVPFCAALCHYCDFNRVAGSTPDERARYVAALHTEIDRVAAAGPGAVAPAGGGTAQWPAFGSVFVGGGTPTLLDPGELGGVVRHVRAALPVAADAEITVEANPETVDAHMIAVLAGAGVNRVSMGAQSFARHVLADLGRWHERDRPLAAVATARAGGIERLSLDLIYGSPAETDAEWAATLDTAVATGVGHLSAYALTVEPGTEYAARVRRGQATAPDDDVQAERMTATDERLTGAGFARYELSNWARPGQECRHNLVYWRGGDWLAFGAGAHGHWRGGDRARRWWNTRPPGRYVAQVEQRGTAVAGDEVLGADDRRAEALMLGLRLTEGVARTAVGPLDETEARRLVTDGLLADDGARLALTPAGRPLANAVTVRLLG